MTAEPPGMARVEALLRGTMTSSRLGMSREEEGQCMRICQLCGMWRWGMHRQCVGM